MSTPKLMSVGSPSDAGSRSLGLGGGPLTPDALQVVYRTSLELFWTIPLRPKKPFFGVLDQHTSTFPYRVTDVILVRSQK